MARTHVWRAIMVCALLALVTGMANAGAWIQWAGGPVIPLTKVEIPISERQVGLEHYVWQYTGDWYGGWNIPPDYEMQVNADWPGHLIATGGGNPGDFVDAQGLPIYIRVALGATNVGTESWVDWHIRTYGGGYKYKAYGDWFPAWNLTTVSNGWDYIMPAGGIPVTPGMALANEVWIRVDPQLNQFIVEEWPTPEPATIVGLLGGIAALGAGLRLRKRSE